MADLDACVALALLRERLRPIVTGRILARVADPRAVLGAGGGMELAPLEPLRPAERDALGSFRAWDAVAAERGRAQRLGLALIPHGARAYPAALRELPDPPALLYARGALASLEHPTVAIVGSRKASVYGVAVARAFARALARAGVTVVSGFARGIDAAAHEGALDAGGATVAVLGCGVDVPYPRGHGHRRLADRLPERGALLSEFPLGSPPYASHFPERNRIVSGLAKAVLVVEAGARSGTSITAHAALEQGRDVFAVPGPIDAPGSVGPHALIREGAVLASEPGHLLTELGLDPASDGARPARAERVRADAPAAAGPAARVLDLLGARPLSLEEVRVRAGLAGADAAAALLDLELSGQVRREPCGGYVATDPFLRAPAPPSSG